MTHEEQRVYLIQELLAEERYKNISIPVDEKEQKDLLRSLMNVRMPKPLSQDFLKYKINTCKQSGTCGGSLKAKSCLLSLEIPVWFCGRGILQR